MIDQKVSIVLELTIEIETTIKTVKIKEKDNKMEKEEDITIMETREKENKDQTTNQNKKTETQMFNNLIQILHYKEKKLQETLEKINLENWKMMDSLLLVNQSLKLKIKNNGTNIHMVEKTIIIIKNKPTDLYIYKSHHTFPYYYEIFLFKKLI